jgi:hypothetical protein
MSDEMPPPGPQFNPQTGYPAGQQAPQHQAQYQAPYQAPGFPAYRADLPKATAAMVVGIISIAGALFCVLPILGAPVAWVLGAQARRQVRAAPQQWGGEGKATAGMVLGIVGTVLLVLGLVAVAILIAVAVNGSTTTENNTGV